MCHLQIVHVYIWLRDFAKDTTGLYIWTPPWGTDFRQPTPCGHPTSKPWLRHYVISHAVVLVNSSATYRWRSLSESRLRLTRSPASVRGDRQTLAGRRTLLVDKLPAIRASTSSSMSGRHTFQLENISVDTRTTTTTTRRHGRRSGLEQHLSDDLVERV